MALTVFPRFDGNSRAARVVAPRTILSYEVLKLSSVVIVSQALCVPLRAVCSVLVGILLSGLGFLFCDYKFTASRIQILELHSQSKNQG